MTTNTTNQSTAISGPDHDTAPPNTSHAVASGLDLTHLDSAGLVILDLTCSHQRHIDPGVARMIAAGHITTQRCHSCGCEQPVAGRPQTPRP
jgi:hypothetical protein